MRKTRYFCQGREITQEEAQRIDQENKTLLESPLETDWQKIKVIFTYTEKEESTHV